MVHVGQSPTSPTVLEFTTFMVKLYFYIHVVFVVETITFMVEKIVTFMVVSFYIYSIKVLTTLMLGVTHLWSK